MTQTITPHFRRFRKRHAALTVASISRFEPVARAILVEHFRHYLAVDDGQDDLPDILAGIAIDGDQVAAMDAPVEQAVAFHALPEGRARARRRLRDRIDFIFEVVRRRGGGAGRSGHDREAVEVGVCRL